MLKTERQALKGCKQKLTNKGSEVKVSSPVGVIGSIEGGTIMFGTYNVQRSEMESMTGLRSVQVAWLQVTCVAGGSMYAVVEERLKTEDLAGSLLAKPLEIDEIVLFPTCMGGGASGIRVTKVPPEVAAITMGLKEKEITLRALVTEKLNCVDHFIKITFQEEFFPLEEIPENIQVEDSSFIVLAEGYKP